MTHDSTKKHCPSCAFYIKCNDAKKSFNYVCEDFSLSEIEENISEFFSEDTDPLTVLLETGKRVKAKQGAARAGKVQYDKELTQGKDSADIESLIKGNQSENDLFLEKEAEFDIAKVMDEASQFSGLVPHDLKLSDSDMQEYPNFYRFCLDDKGLKIKPYLMQIVAATIVFAEFCPICSDLDWLFHDRKVSDSYITLESKVCFLEYGVCPSCSKTRSNLVEKNLLNYYNELAIVAGQRCLVPETRVYTEYGLETIQEIIEGVGLKSNDFTNHTVMLRSKFDYKFSIMTYKTDVTDIYRVTLTDGTFIEGTLEHPIEVYEIDSRGEVQGSEFVKISELSSLNVNWRVPVYVGTLVESNSGDNKIHKEMMISSENGLDINVRNNDLVLHSVFLSALYENAVFDLDKKEIRLTVEHELYALDVTLLLKNLGIYCRLSKENRGFSVYIPNNYFVRYMCTIGRFNQNLILNQNICMFLKSVDYNYDCPILTKYLHETTLCNIRQEVILVEVAKVEWVRKSVTYDFHIPDTHCFMANSLLNHNCTIGSTPVLTEDGLMEIAEYSKNKPLGFSEFKRKIFNGSYLEQTSDYYISEHKEHVKRITTETGHNLTCTDDHPLLVINEDNPKGIMVPTKDLKVGDYLKLRYDTQVFGNKLVYINDIVENTELELKRRYAKQQVNTAWKYDPSKQDTEFLKEDQRPVKLTKKLCELMGLWVAEGASRTFSNIDIEILDHIESGLLEILESSSIYYNYRDGRKCALHLKGSRATVFLEILLEQGLKTGSGDKRIPLSIRQGPAWYQKAFLRGLFEGDGGVEISTTKNVTLSYHGIISHCTICRRLHTQVSAMLMNLGILHRLRYKKAWAANGTSKQVAKTAYIIEIQDKRFINKYADAIGFISSTKTARLQELIDIYDNRRNSKASVFDKLPVCISPSFVSLAKSASCSTSDLKLFGSAVASIVSRLKGNRSCLTFDKAKLVLDKLEQNNDLIPSSMLDTLDTLTDLTYDEGVAYTRIKSIEKSRIKVRTYDFTLPETHTFIGNGLYMENSGKSSLVAMMSAYMTHKIIKLQNPTVVYDLLPNSILHGTFVALTYAQAKDTLWEPYYNYLQSSPWFASYHTLLDHYANKYGEEFYKLRDTFVYYKNRAFLCYASAPHSKVLRGRTRILSSIDEIGLFDHGAEQQKVRTNATEIHISLERSLLTVRSAASRLLRQGFNNVPTGYFFNVSSPFSQYDKVMQLYKSSLTSKKIFGMKLATWEMNPTITMEDLDEEFSKDPVTAWRDYGASPALSGNALIPTHSIVEKAFGLRANGVKLIYANGRRVDKSIYRYADVSWVRKTIKPSVLALDMGFSKNAYSMLCAHREEDEIIVDVIAEVIPLPGVPLNHTKIFENMIEPIIENQKVVYVIADRWNSLKLLSDVEEQYNILTKQYSLKYRDFFSVKTLLEQGLLTLPKPSMPFKEIIDIGPDDYPGKFLTRPTDHLVLQLVTVRDTGTTVVKGDGDLNDDIFRCLTLACYVLTSPDHSELFAKEIQEESEQQEKRIATSRMGMVFKPSLADRAYFTMRCKNKVLALGSAATRKSK